ncbi:MAG TPA: phosphodiester glycosidase family protein [Clostridia bacterium]|nr:phosphodiester glycosidase family protein [Clostridia bacterium]
MIPRRHCGRLFSLMPAFSRTGWSGAPWLLLLALMLGSLPVAPALAAPKPLILSGNDALGKPSDSLAHATITPWQPLFKGVEVCEGSALKPRPFKARAVRIDLRDPDIDFLVTPSNGDAPKEVNARTTSEFLSEFKCQLAINGSVFDVFAKSNAHPMDIQGLSLSRGDLYSEPNEWDALLISSNRQARVARSPIDTHGVWNGLSGFFASLYHGTNYGTMKDRHPRTLAGVTRDGSYLLLLAIDGRQPGYSDGATTAEAAEWMFKLGAFDALNLDGGGSTALVVQGTNGAPQLLNRPSGPPPGTERRVGNHLGVFAKPLPQ